MRSTLSTMIGQQQMGNQHSPASGSGWTGMKHALLAVILFSLTVPFTEIALVSFSPEAIAFTRSGIAGLGSLMMVLLMEMKDQWRLPNRRELMMLFPAGFVVCLVFPYFLSEALQTRSATDMGVLLAGIPLITALVASVFFKERHNKGFWLSALVGTGLLILFNLWSGSNLSGWVEALIIVMSAAIGYSLGGRVAQTLGGWQTICWMSILYLPVSLLGAGYFIGVDARQLMAMEPAGQWDTHAIYALLYLALVSQWLGFHFWYGAMAEAGIARVGQVQLTQPFFTLIFAVWLLSENLYAYQVVFAALICLSVLFAIKHK